MNTILKLTAALNYYIPSHVRRRDLQRKQGMLRYGARYQIVVGSRLLLLLYRLYVFRILVQYETFFTRARGPVIVIAKEEI